MTKKRAPGKAAHNPNMIMVAVEPNASSEVKARLAAQTVLRPSVQAAATINALNKGGVEGMGVMDFVEALDEQVKLINANDLSNAEGMLITQAHTLNEIFNNLARRSVSNINAGYLPAGEAYLRLALKAQSQCRATLETLAEIKNPKAIAFVKQANIGENVQVNNADTVNVPRARARKNKNPPNELLEHQNGERMDVGAPRTAIGADPHMATVGKIDGRENG